MVGAQLHSRLRELLSSKPPRTLPQSDNVSYPDSYEQGQVRVIKFIKKSQLSEDTSENSSNYLDGKQ